MKTVQIEKNPSKERLEELGVNDWDIWTKEVSHFPWFYDCEEVCYFLEGEVEVTPKGQEPVTMGAGDLVTFPVGMECTWAVRRPVRKHYLFR